MPRPLSSAAIAAKNTISSDKTWLLLLEIEYPGETAIRVCLNNTSVDWNGYTWQPAIFELSGVTETKDAEIPDIPLVVYDFAHVITPHLEAYDGGVGATVTMRVVHSSNLASATPEVEEAMEIVDVSIDSKNMITFKLGAENLMTLRCPKNRYLKNHCRFKFKSSRCGYAGAATECSLSFSSCKSLGNEARFGGFPGVGGSGVMA